MMTDTTVGLYRRQLQQQQQHRQRPTSGGNAVLTDGPGSLVGRDVELRRAGYDVPPPPVHRNELLFSPRRRREFTPNHRKDQTYWDRRHRNNEAARRSREKRRLYDIGLERKVVELSKENYVLKVQLIAIKHKFGVSGDDAINAQQVMALLPTNEQMLQSIAKRPRTSPLSTAPSAALYHSRNDVGDSVSSPSSNGHSDRSSPTVQRPQEQHQQQQRRGQRQRDDFCPVDTNVTAARAAYPSYLFASVPAPPPPPTTCQTYTDGALNLVRGPPPSQRRDAPSSSDDDDDDAAAGASPPVIWRAFAAAGPDRSCCQPCGGGGGGDKDDDDKRRSQREDDVSGSAWYRGRVGVGQSWGVGPPSSWLMMAAAAAATCSGCALDATASAGPEAGQATGPAEAAKTCPGFVPDPSTADCSYRFADNKKLVPTNRF